MSKETPKNWRRTVQIRKLSKENRTISEIARIVGCCRETVRDALVIEREEVQGLIDRQQVGYDPGRRPTESSATPEPEPNDRATDSDSRDSIGEHRSPLSD